MEMQAKHISDFPAHAFNFKPAVLNVKQIMRISHYTVTKGFGINLNLVNSISLSSEFCYSHLSNRKRE
jgi:hypothetical protein